MIIQTLIVDDEPHCISELRYQLTSFQDIAVVAEASNVRDALQCLENYTLDLIFLDIHMHDEIAGLKIAKYISTLAHPQLIVFVTAYAKYAQEAYDYWALHYLVKPTSDEKLDAAITRVRTMLTKSTSVPNDVVAKLAKILLPPAKISIKYRRKNNYDETLYSTVYLDAKEISYIETVNGDNVCNVVTHDGKSFNGVRQPLTQLANQLVKHGFFRIHQSYLVNLNCIYEKHLRERGNGSYIVTLKGSKKIFPVSPSKITELTSILG